MNHFSRNIFLTELCMHNYILKQNVLAIGFNLAVGPTRLNIMPNELCRGLRLSRDSKVLYKSSLSRFFSD